VQYLYLLQPYAASCSRRLPRPTVRWRRLFAPGWVRPVRIGRATLPREANSPVAMASCSRMVASVLVEPRDFVRWRCVAGRDVTRRAALATGGSMLSAVGSLDAGQPSSRRTSSGNNTPTCCQLAQEVARVERDQPPEPGQCRLLDRDSLAGFECNRNCLGPRTPLVPPSWLGSQPGAVVRGALSGSRARVHS
jgi:hypothetical protein